MAIPESPVPSIAMAQLTEANKAQVAATLAAAVVVASGKQHSIQQVLDIARDIQFAMYPAPGSGVYVEWEKTKAARLSKVHGA